MPALHLSGKPIVGTKYKLHAQDTVGIRPCSRDKGGDNCPPHFSPVSDNRLLDSPVVHLALRRSASKWLDPERRQKKVSTLRVLAMMAHQLLYWS